MDRDKLKGTEADQLSVLKNYLDAFRQQLINEVKTLLKQGYVPIGKKWIKSSELKEELDIGHGKLQTMRNSRIISFTRVGGTIFYDRQDIENMMEQNKILKNEKTNKR